MRQHMRFYHIMEQGRFRKTHVLPPEMLAQIQNNVLYILQNFVNQNCLSSPAMLGETAYINENRIVFKEHLHLVL